MACALMVPVWSRRSQITRSTSGEGSGDLTHLEAD
jgi:hypothetical protein